jgi:tetratricopeptide (TPR) repeat protein
MAMMQEAAAKFSQGMERLQAKDYEGAAAAFGEAIAVFPQFEPAYRLRSEAYRVLGLEGEARADLEAVISITRTRLQEAEQSLKGRPQPTTRAPASTAQSASGGPAATTAASSARRVIAAQKSGLFDSPIILWTGVLTLVSLVAAVGLWIVGALGSAGGP